MPCWTADTTHRVWRVMLLACLAWIPALTTADTVKEPAVRVASVEPVWRDMAAPAVLTALPRTSAQWLYGTEDGRLYLLHQGSGRAQLLHDFRLPVYGDLGLASVALHPDFRENGRLFVLSATDTPQPLTELTEWHLETSGGLRPELVFRHRLLTVPASTVWCAGGTLGFADSGHLQLVLGAGSRSGVDTRRPGAALRAGAVRLDVDQRQPGAPFTRVDPGSDDGNGPTEPGKPQQATLCPGHSDEGSTLVHDGLRITRVARGPDGDLYGYAVEREQLLRLIPPEPLPLIPITTGSQSD